MKMTTMARFNYQKELLRSYWPLYLSKKSYIFSITGRSAGKTHNIPKALFMKFLKDPNANLIIFRKFQNTIKRSVWNGIVKIIIEKGLEDEFDIIKSEFKIIDKLSGTGIYFFGLDDEGKIRSTVFEYGYPKLYWFEEFQENKRWEDLDQIDDLIDTFIREKLPANIKHQFVFSGNLRRNPYDDFNVYIDKKKEFADEDDALFVESSYADVVDNFTGESLLSDQIHKKIERTKERDYDTYLWRYHAQPVGDEGQVYNVSNIKRVSKRELSHDYKEKIKHFFIVVDTGYQVSASALQVYGVTFNRNVVLMRTKYFSPDSKISERIPKHLLKPHTVALRKEDKITPSELSREIVDLETEIKNEFGINCHSQGRIVDSAEGGLRNEYRRHTGRFLRTVIKKEKEDMIEASRNITIERDFYVLDENSNDIFMYEMEKYSRDFKDPLKPKIIKVDDHTVDCFQYFAVMAGRQLGLEV